ILDANRELLAAGHHARVGQAHAEVHALSQISDKSKLKGAHVYVTLEPCAHHGRTPPCADALAALPIASVTYGLDDPNPKVSGKGAARIREAGIKVERFPELVNEFEEVGEVFLTNQRHKKPFIAVKIASSLDGQIAMKNG